MTLTTAPKMSCFEWNNRSSDYLDGALPQEIQSSADEHLETCKECSERHKRYRMILTSISSQPRSSLPVPIRKAPFSAAIPRLDRARLSKIRWEQVPWYIRTSTEGAAIVLMILLGISVGPRLRAIYERGMEQNLAEFTQSFQDTDSTDNSAAPLVRGKAVASDGSGADSSGALTEEFTSGDDGGGASGGALDSDDSDEQGSSANGAGTDDGSEDIRAGKSEIWRFIIKTSSPHEIRPQIVRLLTALRIPANTPGLGGVEAPGGIQFDLLVPQSSVVSLKRQLQSLAPKRPAELANSPVGETFTWYKNKSRRKIPDGRTRIVIWLSQM